jgi:RimJ/RimL family protein N-acetyltransferase
VLYLAHADLKFSPVQVEDFDDLIALRNDPSTWSNLTDPLPLSREKQEGWLRSTNTCRDRFYWTAKSDANGFVGVVRLDEYAPLHRSIRIGADVVPRLRGRGYGKQIYATVIGWCFDQLNVHRIWLLVLDTNARGQALYAKMGFQVEGRMRQAIWRDGAWRDYVMMSLLDGDLR